MGAGKRSCVNARRHAASARDTETHRSMANKRRIIEKMRVALPALRSWVDRLLVDYANRVEPVSSPDFCRLPDHFSPEILQRARVVTVSTVPFPPLSQWGLSEFSALEAMPVAGITFDDTFFVRQDCRTESLYFHELVHVVQWDELGADHFLMAYGVGLLQCGYAHSPLERMAYDLQQAFERHRAMPELERTIRRETRSIAVRADLAV